MNHNRDAHAWKERCLHEDKAALSFINSYVLAKEMSPNNSFNQPLRGSRSNIPPGFKTKGLPHLLSPLDNDDRMSTNRSNASSMRDDAMTDRSSVRSYKSTSSNKSTKSTKSTLDEESRRKIELLEKSLDEERKGRLEVQQELQHLKQLIKENLKK